MDSQLELSTTSILSLFETTKSQRESFVGNTIREVEAGTVDPLKIHLQVKCMEDIIKLMNSNSIYKTAVLEAAEKYGQKSFEYKSSKVEIKEVGVKYDFSKCGDLLLNGLYENQKVIDDEVKKRETMLKTVSAKGLIITDEGTGDTYTVYPPAKSSTTSVAITLK